MREPLILLHGVTNSSSIWGDVIPLLSEDFDVIAPTARGHRGGVEPQGPVTVAQLVDDVERLLDDSGLGRVHIAGNSLGGWVALELARRGRALSVCALSPAGFWTAGASDETHATNAIRNSRSLAKLARPILPIILRSSGLRRRLLRDVAVNGDQVTADAARNIVEDLIHCVAAPDLLGSPEVLRGFDDVPCPITLAWSGEDKIFPPHVNGAIARRLIPGATYFELPDVGHLPMLDDSQLVATVIRGATAR